GDVDHPRPRVDGGPDRSGHRGDRPHPDPHGRPVVLLPGGAQYPADLPDGDELDTGGHAHVSGLVFSSGELTAYVRAVRVTVLRPVPALEHGPGAAAGW